MTEYAQHKEYTQNITNSFDINTCHYPPQENRQGVPSYDNSHIPQSVPIIGESRVFISSLVLPWNTEDIEKWRQFFDENTNASHIHHNEQIPESNNDQLEAIVQAIVEHGQEMLPLLGILREKAETDTRLSGLLKTLQDRLNLGINAACSLSPREMEVLELASKGLSSTQISESLNIQPVTVTKTLSRAYRKLGAKNRAEAVQKWTLLQGSR